MQDIMWWCVGRRKRYSVVGGVQEIMWWWGGGRVGGLENAQAVKLAIAGSESAKSATTSNRNENSKIVFLSSATLDTVAR